ARAGRGSASQFAGYEKKTDRSIPVARLTEERHLPPDRSRPGMPDRLVGTSSERRAGGRSMGISRLDHGIVRIEDAGTNCYVMELPGGLVFVDAGLPRTSRFVHEALAVLGRTWDEVTDVVLTHAHFDHLGFAAKAQRETGARVWV